MTFSDSRWRALEEAAVLARGTGRPRNSPGWGMLVAVKSGEFSPERDPSERVTITAGTTYVSPDYWLARERPELFKLGDRRDTRTYRARTRNLEHARLELERERPTGPRRRTDALRLPGQPFRLPRHYKAFKLPRRTPTRRVLP
jgi:hypothetical protein